MTMTKKRIMVFTMILFAFCLFSKTTNTKVFAESEDEVITKGVYIDSIDIGGMTVDEAKQAVKDYVDNLKSKRIVITVEDEKETITLNDFDYDYEDNNYIEDALVIGKSGNLIKRYKELKDTEESNLIYNLEFKLDDKKIKKFVEKKLSEYDIKAENAGIKRVNGEFQYTDHKVGRKIEVDQTVEAIKNAVLGEWNQQDLELPAVVVDDQPKYTKDMVEKCNTVLASFSTTYTTSSSDRAGNLANGARLINNTVLYPGDVFSAYEKLTPFTTDNGYFEAGAYANGKVVDSIGGGACQVTTTLYNAVLLSELEIVERAAHSMTIGYVDLSRDAAIAGTWKDLKFKNDSDSPILIEAYTHDRTITFNVWGNETRDTKNRKIKFETVVLDEKQPGKDVITEDKTKPTSYVVTTQAAHIGYTAELYKVIYENGVEVSRTRINKSIYNPSPRYITVGTKEEEPVKEEPKDDSKDDSKNNPKDDKKNNNTTPQGDNPDDTLDDTTGNNGINNNSSDYDNTDVEDDSDTDVIPEI
jgi:vancomycin resistance protein YoaR